MYYECANIKNKGVVKMKKVKYLIVIVVMGLMMLTMASCGKTGACDNCGQNESLKKFTDSYGNENWYCDDCYRMAKLFA